MGGGVAMRAAASKMAGLGVVGPGAALRGLAPAAAPGEQAVRKSPVPVSAILSSSSASASRAAVDAAPAQRPAWELDGWELAGGEEDLVMTAGEPVPRVVFAGVPTFDEAKEATVELKDALDKVYLSSPESWELAASDKRSGLSLFSNPESEIKSPLVVETVPKHAFKAFKLLSTSTEVQNVVASIASDSNVWKAVLQNSVLQEFMQSNQTVAEFEEPVPMKSEDSDCSEDKDFRNWFTGMLENVKLSVIDLVSSLSSKLQSIFGFSADASEDAKASHADMTIGIGASFIGLATLVVMVVLLKRA